MDHEIAFRVLGGDEYLKNNQPPVWRNPSPLPRTKESKSNPFGLQNLPYDQFPLIGDFHVVLEEGISDGDYYLGFHVKFRSESLGDLAHFPWWDHAERDLARDEFPVPVGDLVQPFNEVEEGWELTIAEHMGRVYVLERDYDDPAAGYHSWFAVETTMYMAAWQSAVELCRQHFG